MSKGSLVDAKRGFLARSPTPLFLFFCIASAIVGSLLTFFVLAVGIAIFDAAMAREGDSYEPVVLALATILGFIIPPIVLTRKRRTARRQSQTADSQQPLNAVIGDGARIAKPVDNDSRAGLSYQAPPTPPPLDQHPSIGRESEVATLIPLAADIALQNAGAALSPQKSKPHLARRLIGPVAFLIIALSLLAFFFAGGEPGLELRAGNGSITITNLKNDPAVEIVNIVVNGRDECSTDGAMALCRQMPNAQNPAFVSACSRLSKFDRQQLHTAWVHGGVSLFANRFPERPISLRIGDSHIWATACPRVVQVQVVTDRGSATYSFSE